MDGVELIQDTHFIDVIPSEYRYENDAKSVTELSGVGDVYADRLHAAGITNTHMVGDAGVEELTQITNASTTEVNEWLEQIPEATIYDDEEVWMTIMVIPGTGDMSDIMGFVDSITGKEEPFDGDTVRFYRHSNPPENVGMDTNLEALHSGEIDVITTAIQEWFDMPISQTPYAAVMSTANE
jgi:hypothetical protein